MFVESNPIVENAESKDMILDGDESSVKLLKLQINRGDDDEKYDLVDGVDYELAPGKLTIRASALAGAKKPVTLTTVFSSLKLTPVDLTE